MQSLASQLYAFVATLVMGLAIGLLFDFYKVTKGIFRPGKILGGITDLLFWVISTLTVYFLLLIGNWGEIRLYVVIGVIIGAAVYFKLFSSGVLWVFRGIFHYLKQMIMFCLKIIGMVWIAITYPFVLVRNIVVIPIGFLSTLLAKFRQALARLLSRTVAAPFYRLGKNVKDSGKRWWRSIFKKS